MIDTTQKGTNRNNMVAHRSDPRLAQVERVPKLTVSRLTRTPSVSKAKANKSQIVGRKKSDQSCANAYNLMKIPDLREEDTVQI